MILLGIDPAIKHTGLALWDVPGGRIWTETASLASRDKRHELPFAATSTAESWLVNALVSLRERGTPVPRVDLAVIENNERKGPNAATDRDMTAAKYAWATAVAPFCKRIEYRTPAQWRSKTLHHQTGKEAWKAEAIRAATRLVELHSLIGRAPTNDHEAEALMMALDGRGLLKRMLEAEEAEREKAAERRGSEEQGGLAI